MESMTGVEHVLKTGCILGEGPLWHVAEQRLYWVDIQGKSIHTYQPENGSHQQFSFDDLICALAFREQGGLLIATRKHLAFWDGHSAALDRFMAVEADDENTRFNDGAVDRQGRFWIGTMDNHRQPTGRLYRLDADLTLHTMVEQVHISNGIGWTPDNKTMFYTDTTAESIYAYDFEPASGQMSNRRVIVDTTDEVGHPDGLTTDSEGYIWGASWGGSKITRYAPDGQVDRVVELPVPRVTSCTFGGPQLKDLYITTAWVDEAIVKRYPLSGDLFKLRVDVAGLPEPAFAG